MTGIINFNDKLRQFSGHWQPKVIAQMNDYQFKLVKVQGEFVWHGHEETDEVFIVLSGSLSIALPDGTITLNEGEMYVVPKGLQHKPFAEKECHLLLVEPEGVTNTGEAGGELTAQNDVWI